MMASLLLLFSLWSAPTAACTKLVFPFAAYDSPFIVEGTVSAIEGDVAVIEIHDVLKEPAPRPSLPLRVLIREVGYGAACETWLGEASLSVGDRAFLMLTGNELGGDAPWRPHGDYAAGLRLIKGEQVFSGGRGRWEASGTTAVFRAEVALGGHQLRQRSWEAEARAEESACNSGNAEACRLRARTMGPADPVGATALLRVGCSLAEAESCLQYGLVLLGEKVHEHYDSTPSQVADVAHHVSADCAAGAAEACSVKERALRAAQRALEP